MNTNQPPLEDAEIQFVQGETQQTAKLSFISTKLANPLKLKGRENGELSIASFDNKTLKKIGEQNVTCLMEKEELDGRRDYWEKSDILIGVKDFVKFIKLGEAQELKSGFLLLQRLGPLLAEDGYIDDARNKDVILVETALTASGS
ncbi:hypothetical protein DINM_006118 [Dirofilaria immitis]|nr:hypothetical protein [Dirofilaria immitis]